MASPDLQKRLVNQVFDQLQKQYEETQKTEVIGLYSKFSEAIEEVDPTPTNLLLVLELLRNEFLGKLSERFEQIKATKVPKEE